MPTIPQEIAESTQALKDNTLIVQQFAQGTQNIQIPTAGGNLRPLSYWQAWFQQQIEARAQPYVEEIEAAIGTATGAAQSAGEDAQQTGLDRQATSEDRAVVVQQKQAVVAKAQQVTEDASQAASDRVATGEARAAASQSAEAAEYWAGQAGDAANMNNYYTKAEVDTVLGDIGLILDQINGV